jgi:hypothetical protein
VLSKHKGMGHGAERKGLKKIEKTEIENPMLYALCSML